MKKETKCAVAVGGLTLILLVVVPVIREQVAIMRFRPNDTTKELIMSHMSPQTQPISEFRFVDSPKRGVIAFQFKNAHESLYKGTISVDGAYHHGLANPTAEQIQRMEEALHGEDLEQ